MSLSRKSSFASKADHCEVEEVPPRDALLERYALIKDKTEDELKAIEKSLVRKLDWKFLPMVTAMLLMKYAGPPPFSPLYLYPWNTLLTISFITATWTASTSPTPASQVCSATAT